MFIRKDFLRDDNDYEKFIEIVDSVVGVKFSKEYLKQGQTRVFKNAKGDFVGGYAMILNGPLRTIRSIPQESRSKLIKEEDLIEVTGLWLDQSLKAALPSAQFWLTFSQDLSSFKEKKQFIYAYDVHKKALTSLYSLAKPKVLYRGKTIKLEGMKEETRESIEIACCRNIRSLPFYGAAAIFKRAFAIKKINQKKSLIIETWKKMREA